jgi:hypothetical protein
MIKEIAENDRERKKNIRFEKHSSSDKQGIKEKKPSFMPIIPVVVIASPLCLYRHGKSGLPKAPWRVISFGIQR